LNKKIAEVGLTHEPSPLRQNHVIIHSICPVEANHLISLLRLSKQQAITIIDVIDLKLHSNRPMEREAEVMARGFRKE
jgi:hypothetical protein